LLGLRENPEKCTLFCAGASRIVKDHILACLQIKEGKLPVHCLGVPLISTKLNATDCSSLIRHM
jgi:hypothetical protein